MAVTEELLVKLTVDASGTVKAAKIVGDSFKDVGDAAKKAKKETTNFEKGLEKAGLAVVAINQGLEILDKTMGAVNKTVGTFVNGFADFESALVGVQKTTNISGEQLAQFGQDMQDLSTTIPVAANELLNIAQNAGQLGVANEDLEKFTETVAKIGFATDLTSEQAAQSFARILTVTGEGTGAIDTFASTIVALGNNFAATESEITRVATEMANATAQFNIGSTNVLGLSTAMKAMGQQAQLAGSVVGKTFREMNTIIRDGSGPAFQALADLTGMTGDQLQKTFRDDATAVFEAFVGGLNQVAESGGNVSATLEAFGLKGDEVNKVLPTLAVNADVLSSALKLARGEANLTAEELEKIGALNVEAGNAFGTLRARLDIAGNALDNLAASIGQVLAPAVTVIVEAFTDFVKFAKEVTDGLQRMGIPGQIIVWTALGTAIASMLAVAIIPMIAAFKAAIPVLAGAAAAAKAFLVPVAVVAAKVIAITAAVAALAAGLEILIRNWDEFGSFAEAVINELGNLFKELGVLFLDVFGSQHQIVVDAYHLISVTVQEFFDWFMGIFETTSEAVGGFWDSIVSGAKFAFDTIAGFIEPFITPFITAFELIAGAISGLFNGILNSAREMFNELLQNVVQPAIDAINSVIEAGASFFDGAVQKIEISLGKIGDEAELTGKRLDTGITGEALAKVTEQINKFKGVQEEAAQVAAFAAPTYETVNLQLNGTSQAAAESAQRLAVLEERLGDTALNSTKVAEEQKKVQQAVQLTEEQIKAQEEAAKAAAKAREKATEDLIKANKQLEADIMAAGATETQVIAQNLAARMEELDQLEQMVGKTQELAQARALAKQESEAEILALQAEALQEIVDMNQQLALDNEMFDLDREERIEKLAQLEIERLETSLAQLEAQGLATDEIRKQAKEQKKLIEERAAQETGSRPLDQLAAFGGGALMAFDPANIDMMTGIVDSITDFPTKLLESLGKLDEALMRFIDEFPQAFAKLAENLGPIITKIIRALPKVAVTFIQTIVKNLPKIVEGIVMGIKEIAKVLPDLIIGIVDNLGPLIEALAEAMPVIVVALVEALIDLIASGGALRIAISLTKAIVFTLPIALAKGLLKGLSRMLPGLFGKLGGNLLKPLTGFMNVGNITKIFEPIKKLVEQSFMPVKVLFEKVIKPIFDAWVQSNKVIFEQIVKPIFMAFVEANRVIFEQIVKPIFQLWVESNKVIFEQIVKPIFELWVESNKVLFEQIIKPIFELWIEANKVLFEQIIKPIFDLWVQSNKVLFEQIVKPIFQFLVDTLGKLFNGLRAAFDQAQVVFNAFTNVFSATVNVLKTSFEFIKAPFEALKVAMDNIRNPMVALEKAFTILTDPFRKLGEALQGVLGPMKTLADALNGFNPGNLFGGGGGGGGGTFGAPGILTGDKSRGPVTGIKGSPFAAGGPVPDDNVIHIARFAQGGLAEMFQPQGTDTVPAMLTPGEFVINRPAVQAVGEPFLRAINSGGTVPVNQNISVTLNIDAGGQQLDEAFIKQRIMPAAVEAVKRASLDRKFTMSARGLRST